MTRAVLVLTIGLFLSVQARAGELAIRSVDTQTGDLVPVRIELLDDKGDAFVARDALPLRSDCIVAPLPSWLDQAPIRDLHNPYTDTRQFYSDGLAHVDLAPGTYTMRAYRGPEYKVTRQTIEITDEDLNVLLSMERWTDPASRGWFGADDHLHITRLSPEENDRTATWLRAEGLHIGNLLAMGTLTHFGASPQYAFGDAGVYRDRDVLLLTGQEHPRTHIFGHTISLGASEKVDRRDSYADYHATFSDVRNAGGINGFAHWGTGPARKGIAMNAPTGLVEFVEVLQFEIPYYEVWYQLLNLGLKITATAGTDFPCLSSVPGRERFYTQIEGQPSREKVVEAIRNGRTFVTNGPQISIEVAGTGPGSDVRLTEPGLVRVVGQVAFDPEQDDVEQLSLMVNGVEVPVSVRHEPGLLQFDDEIEIAGNSWFAVRSQGLKLGETAPEFTETPAWLQVAFNNWISGGGGPEIFSYLREREARASAAHTSPVYVHIEGSTSTAPNIDNIEGWLEQLDQIEQVLMADEIDAAMIWDWMPYSDGVSAKHLLSHKQALLQSIKFARAFYESKKVPTP